MNKSDTMMERYNTQEGNRKQVSFKEKPMHSVKAGRTRGSKLISMGGKSDSLKESGINKTTIRYPADEDIDEDNIGFDGEDYESVSSDENREEFKEEESSLNM